MTRRRLAAVGALLGFVASLLGGCGGDDADSAGTTTSTTGDSFAACVEAVERIGAATERYVAGYETGILTAPVAVDDATTTSDPGLEPLDEGAYQEALETAQQELAEGRCDPRRTQIELLRVLDAVDAESPVADAVLRQITAGMTDPVAAEPSEITAAPGDDLRDVVARAADGSTVVLEAGEYRMDVPLVLLSGVRLVGAGRDATTIISSAGDAAVVALTDQTVRLEGLSVRHGGDRPASVVLGGPAASIAVTDSRLAGARADDDGQGGAGVLMFATDREGEGRGTTLEMTDVELLENEAAGVVLSGGHRTSVVRARIVGSGQCGMCFFDTTGGSVEESTFENNAVGLAVAGASAPSLFDLDVRGGEVGAQVGGQSAPAFRDIDFSGQGRAAAIYTDAAGGSIDAVRCVDVEFGLVVGPDVLPRIGEIDCEVVRSPE